MSEIDWQFYARMVFDGPTYTAYDGTTGMDMLTELSKRFPNIQDFHSHAETVFFAPQTERFIETPVKYGYPKVPKMSHDQVPRLKKWTIALETASEPLKPYIKDLCDQYRSVIYAFQSVEPRDCLRLSKEIIEGDIDVLARITDSNLSLDSVLNTDAVILAAQRKILDSMPTTAATRDTYPEADNS